MITILAVLLLTNPSPSLYCQELHVELRRAVEEGWLVDKEADDIYNRCLTRTASAS